MNLHRRNNYFSIWKCLIGVVVFLFSISANAQNNFEKTIDSLKLKLEKTSIPTQQVDILNEISFNYRRVIPEKVIEYANKANALAVQHDYKKGMAIASKNLGVGYFKMGVSRDSIVECYQIASQIAKEIGDYYTEIACLNNIALIYNTNQEFHTGIQYLLKAVELYDKHYTQDNQLKATMIANIGVAYYWLSDFDKSLQYLEKALRIADTQHLFDIQSIYLDDLARTLTKLNRLDEAESVFDDALLAQKKLGDYQSYIQTLQYKIELALKRSQYNKAELYGLQALGTSQIQEFPALYCGTLNRLVEVSLLAEDYDKVIEYGERSLAAAQKSEMLSYEREVLGYLLIAYGEKKMYAKAYASTEQYLAIKEQLQEKEDEKLTANLEAKYQNNKQEQQIDYLNTQKSNQRIRINLLIGLLIVILISIASVVFLYFKRKQSSQIIADKNQKLQQYIQYNMELENFANIASHDLKTPLRTIVSFSQLLKRKSYSKLDTNEKEYLDYVIKGTKEMSLLVDDLLSYAQIQGKKIQIEPIATNTLLNDVLMAIDTEIKEKNAIVQLDLQVPTINGDPTKLKQMLQNLISNAIKFHQPNELPQVTVSLLEEDKYWKFAVKDNGIGIEPDYFEKIFLIFKRLQGKETHEGSGIGLAICKKVAEQHQGQIWVESQMGVGSIFYVTIDKKLLGS